MRFQPFFLALLLIAPMTVSGQIRVAVQDETPTGSGAPGIVDQLNDDTWFDFTATLVTAADIDTLAELSNFDVVVLGDAGSREDNWTPAMQTAVSQFVNAGGGAVLVGWGTISMGPGDEVLEAVFPGSNILSDNEWDASGNTLEILASHPITNGLTDFSVAAGCCTEVNTKPLETGDVVLATMDSIFGPDAKVVMTKEVGSGYSVYVGLIYMADETGYSAMFPALRTGNPDRLLEQAVAWAAQNASPSGIATFNVTKTFSDGIEDTVEVTLKCNGGLPLEQSFTITGGDPDGVVFTVNHLPEAGAACSVSETGGPDGYTTELNNGDGCHWEEVTGGDFVCEIVNLADDGNFTVYMEWDFNHDDFNAEANTTARVTIWCDDEITPGSYDSQSENWYYQVLLGSGDSATVDVNTLLGEASCWAVQSIEQSGVESEDSCEAQEVGAAEEVECTFTNTVFYEGIPTLNPYGLAVLILTTLGVGFVLLRRNG